MKRLIAPALAGLLCLSSLAGAAEQGPDELWETTMVTRGDGAVTMPEISEEERAQMRELGIEMPAAGKGPGGQPGMTMRVCQKKGARDEERLADEHCRITESRKVGRKQLFKLSCQDGADRWTVEGEMENQGKDAWRGRTLVKGTREGKPYNMEMESSGRRVGNCTHGEDLKRVQAQAQQAQAEAQARTTQECNRMMASLEPFAFFGSPDVPVTALPCRSRQAEFCAQVSRVLADMREPPGFEAAVARYGDRWSEAARVCGTDPAKVRAPVCRSAVDGARWPFVATHCSAEAAALRQKHCAGRTGGTVERSRAEMCSALGGLSYTADVPRQPRAGGGLSYTTEVPAAPSPAEPPPRDAGRKSPADMLKEGADRLKKFLKLP